MNKILRYSFVALLAMVMGNANAGVVDDLTASSFNITSSNSYADFTATGTSGATYAAQAMSTTDFIQIRSKNSNSGVVVTTSVGTIKSITITYNAEKIGTNAGEIDVYAKNSAYSAPSDLYGDNAGDKVVQLTASSNSYTFTGSYAYFGIRSTNGARYIDKISVEWETSGQVSTKTATAINFAEGYQTQIAGGPDDLFPEIGSAVALPTATIMAGEVTVENTVDWSLEVKSWKGKEGKPQPSISEGKINVADGYGVLEVTASYAGDNTYEKSSKKYTLTVYNAYGLLKEMAEDIADPDCTKDDEADADGKPVFYFFRNIDADGFPVATSTVTYVNGQYIYLTDGNGANLLFYGTNTQKLKQGDVISGNVGDKNLGGFWGNLKRYRKLPEFAFTDMNVKVESEGATVEPTTITVDQLKDNISAYVKVENAEFVSASGKNLTFKVGETELALYNQFGLDDETVIKALEAGAKYNVEGMVSIYKKDKNTDAVYQLYPISFIKTGETSINTVKNSKTQNGAIYNIAGQKVSASYKGLVIMNGKKYVNK